MSAHSRAQPSRRATDSSEMEELVSALLHASRALLGISVKSMADLEEGVTGSQFRTLVVIDSLGETNLNRLASVLEVNSSTALRSVDRLIAAGLVVRNENPVDRREVLLGLTPPGAAIVRRVTSRRRASIGRVVAKMPPGDRSELIRALRAFTDAAGEPEPSESSIAELTWGTGRL